MYWSEMNMSELLDGVIIGRARDDSDVERPDCMGSDERDRESHPEWQV